MHVLDRRHFYNFLQILFLQSLELSIGDLLAIPASLPWI